LRDNLSIAVSAKVRIFPELEETIKYAKMIEKAGADFITVHGRTRSQKSFGLANWDYIKEIKKSVNIPVIANGNIQTFNDVQKCLEYTGVNAVMTADALLYNPSVFTGKSLKCWESAQILLEYYDKYKETHYKSCKYVLYKLYVPILEICPNFGERISKSRTIEDLFSLNRHVEKALTPLLESFSTNPEMYMTKLWLPFWINQARFRSDESDHNYRSLSNNSELVESFLP
ncbi:MAG: tRNA-dihydrouridine(16/17) synthase [NAD(P)(+)]-like protein, partial [Paramarteilia canceri]